MSVNYMAASDILHILDLFRLPTNVTKARIYLPGHLNEDESLRESKEDTEESRDDDEEQVPGRQIFRAMYQRLWKGDGKQRGNYETRCWQQLPRQNR